MFYCTTANGKVSAEFGQARVTIPISRSIFHAGKLDSFLLINAYILKLDAGYVLCKSGPPVPNTCRIPCPRFMLQLCLSEKCAMIARLIRIPQAHVLDRKIQHSLAQGWMKCYHIQKKCCAEFKIT